MRDIDFRRAGWGAVAVMGITACTSSPEPAIPVCGPTSTIERVAIESRPYGLIGAGEQLLYDNGSYVFIDRECRYWISNPSELWDETRTGTLDEAAALEIGESLRLSRWDDHAGGWSNDVGIADGGYVLFDDLVNTVSCSNGCDGAAVPDDVNQMKRARPQIAADLWNAGTPITSGVRVVAFASDPGQTTVSPTEWPLTRPITDFVIDRMDAGYGRGVLESELDAANALKALRASYIYRTQGTWPRYLPVTSNGASYEVYLRDALPFEDEMGFVPTAAGPPR